MYILWILLGCFGTLALCALIAATVCYFRIFYASEASKRPKSEFDIPEGEVYERHREGMIAWMKAIRAMDAEWLSLRSHDGLTLRSRFFDFGEGTPIEIMLHGYRGNAERDLSGGVLRAKELGHSVLLVEQRSAGASEGHTVTFGVLEKRDALAWARLLAERFPSRPLILTGVSMGAATVMACAGDESLPDSVIGVLADCGYTSARDIIKKVMREMHLPADLLYPFAILGARLFGHFDLNETPPVEALKHARVPVIFFHGDADDFVPAYMSEENFAACSAKKRLVIIEGAGHGLAYPINKQKYLEAMREFFTPLYPKNEKGEN